MMEDFLAKCVSVLAAAATGLLAGLTIYMMLSGPTRRRRRRPPVDDAEGDEQWLHAVTEAGAPRGEGRGQGGTHGCPSGEPRDACRKSGHGPCGQ